MNDVTQIFLILIAFEVKQFICDYPIHPTFILKRFQTDGNRAFILHALAHACLTFLICFFMTTAELPLIFMLASLDFLIDFMLAIFRSRTQLIAHWRPLDLEEFMLASRRDKVRHRLFWAAYGLSRTIRHLTALGILYILSEQGLVWMM